MHNSHFHQIIDSYDKLREILCYEMCHVAAWIIDHESKAPHIVVYERWA